MKKTRRNRREEEFFEVCCSIDGQTPSLSLKIPVRLYGDFENCMRCSEGMGILTSLYESYFELSPLHKETFQMLIFENKNRLLGIYDMLALLRAMVKIFPAE